MAEELQLNINIETKGSDVMKILKADLKEANGELIKAQTLYGEYSEQALKAANKVAQLKDKIQEAKETADLFDPGKKFQALTGTITTLTGGFSALQGAMGLFGGESENVAKALLKVQSAMALSQGLSTIKDGAKDFQRLGAIIKENVVSAFTTLRGAIIATGLGALSVGIGLLIANWDKFVDTIKKSFPVVFTLADKISSIVTKITDWVGITSEAERNQKKLNEALKEGNKQLENQIRVLEATEGKENEVYKKKKELIENQIKLIQKGSKTEKEEREKLQADLQILDLNETKRKKAKFEADKAEDKAIAKFWEDWEAQKQAKRKEKTDKFSKEPIGQDGLTQTERDLLQKQQAEKDAKWKKKYDDDMEALNKGALAKKLETQAQADANSIKQAEDTAEAKKRIDELEKESKLATISAIGNTVAGLSNLIGQETAVGKGIAIASATIDTYQSASTAFKQAQKNPISVLNPAYPYLVAAPAVLSGIARVKSIMSVPVPNAGGGGASAPSINTASPIGPVVPTATTTNISNDSINKLGNQAIRAYVVESDVTSNQKRIEAIRQRARFN